MARSSSMMRSVSGRARANRHQNLNPSLESLEARLVLSHQPGAAAALAKAARAATAPMTVTMPALANGMIGNVATHRMMVIRGQTLAGGARRFEYREYVAGHAGKRPWQVPIPSCHAIRELRSANSCNEPGGQNGLGIDDRDPGRRRHRLDQHHDRRNSRRPQQRGPVQPHAGNGLGGGV